MEKDLHRIRAEAEKIYQEHPTIRCPYFDAEVALTSDGFHHLQFKGNREPRNTLEQILKLSLLKKGLSIIKRSGTVQEHRVRLEKVGKPARDGFTQTKTVEYWGFEAIIGTNKEIKMTTVCRRVGDGKIMFWSVLPHKKLNRQKLYTEGIEDN